MDAWEELAAKYGKPAEASPADPWEALRGKYSAPVSAPESATETPAATPAQKQTGGIMDSPLGGLLRGIRDPIDAGAQILVRGLNAVGVVPDSEVKRVEDINRGAEADYRQNWRGGRDMGVDPSRIAGNIAATLPIAAALPVAATTAGKIASGIGQGAAFGGMQKVEGDDFAREKLAQVGLGALTGGVASGAAAGLQGAFRGAANPNVQLLRKEGVTPTIGQTLGGRFNALEEKLQSIPILGDAISNARGRALEQFNQSALNRAVSPIGESVTTTGREGLSQAKAALSNAYNTLLPKMRFDADPQFAADMAKITQMASTLPQAEASAFNNVIRNQVIGKLTPAGSMSGETFKQVESELSRVVKGYLGDPSFDKRQIGSALAEVLKSMRGSLQRSNPQFANELTQINQGFANFARLRDAASRIGAEEGLFTPAQLQSAVRSADKTVGKGSFATGNALLQDLSEAGKTVLGNKVPNSFTTDRALIAGGTLGSYFLNPAIPAGLLAGAGAYSSPVQGLLTRAMSSPALARGAGVVSPFAAAIGAPSVAGLLQ